MYIRPTLCRILLSQMCWNIIYIYIYIYVYTADPSPDLLFGKHHKIVFLRSGDAKRYIYIYIYIYIYYGGPPVGSYFGRHPTAS